MALEAIGIITQDADPGGTTLVYSCNGLNKMSRLVMLLMVHHF